MDAPFDTFARVPGWSAALSVVRKSVVDLGLNLSCFVVELGGDAFVVVGVVELAARVTAVSIIPGLAGLLFAFSSAPLLVASFLILLFLPPFGPSEEPFLGPR